jgi:hypothetical protein
MSTENDNPNLDDIFKEIIERQDQIVEEHGHACTSVFPTDEAHLEFPFVYTVGLSDVDWPELMCVAPRGVDPEDTAELSMSILNAFVRALRSTETKPTAGIMLKTTALRVPIALIDVDEARVPEFFKGARHRAMRSGRSPDAVTGLQVVWPDRAGKFPWDVDYDAAGFPQPLVGKPPATFSPFKFYDPSCPATFLGFQIADANGKNIQGDDNDPSRLPSFHIMNEFEATEVMAKFGQQYSLTLQPIYEGDIEEPSFADMTDTQAIWPADSGAVLGCEPQAIVKIAIKSACDNAPYRERDVDNPNWEPEKDDVEFWDRVKANADRIADWALSGLSISRRAIPLADGELEDLASDET